MIAYSTKLKKYANELKNAQTSHLDRLTQLYGGIEQY